MNLQKYLNEAIKAGITTKSKLSLSLWPESSYQSRYRLLDRLCKGEASIKPEWVNLICEELKITPNQLFENENN